MLDNSEILDLRGLREITAGNKEAEKMIFETFIEVFSKALLDLQKNIENSQATVWQEQAHFMRGCAGNLGAKTLAAFCLEAEENPDAPKEEKQNLLGKMEQQFAKVKELLLFA